MLKKNSRAMKRVIALRLLLLKLRANCSSQFALPAA